MADAQMLTWAARLYVQTVNTPMAQYTQLLLESSLALAAITSETDHYQELVAWAQNLPEATRADLFSEIDRLVERHPVDRIDGSPSEAALLSIPVTVITDHPTVDVSGPAYELMRASMRRHGLLDATAEVVIMPWLTQAPAEHQNPVRRLRLLQSLVGRLSSGLTPDYDGLAQKLRPAEEPELIDERVACVRYLTIALYTSGDVRALGDRLWHDPAYQDKAEAWLDEMSQLLAASGRYEFAQAGLPTSPTEADMEGNLQRAGTEVSMFIIEAARTPGFPLAAECAVVMRPERRDGVKTHVHVRYTHQGETLKAIRVALPVTVSPEHVGLIGHAISGAAFRAAEDAGVGDIHDLDL